MPQITVIFTVLFCAWTIVGGIPSCNIIDHANVYMSDLTGLPLQANPLNDLFLPKQVNPLF